jgi:nucleoside-diphosphate-sugar epimerase
MLRGKASKVPFVQADITSETSTNDAFNAPWPKDVSRLPLTVFHTAAVINPSERMKSLLFRCSAVNTTGTAHVMSAAKAVGADIFVATASASIAVRPVQYWIPPWKQWPVRFFQVYGEDDAYQPLRGHYDYFGNYAVSKAQAEKLVLEANSPSFKTGCIRPANGVYGNKFDHTVGTYAKIGNVPT